MSKFYIKKIDKLTQNIEKMFKKCLTNFLIFLLFGIF